MSRVLVTGAASGLGAALTAAFRARGDEVLATDVAFESSRSRDGRRATSSTSGGGVSTGSTGGSGSTSGGGVSTGSTDGEATGVRLDITSDDDWAAALGWVEEHWGGLDVLVNNAGVAGGGRIDVAGIDEWQWIVDVNLLGAVRGCRAFTPAFKRQRSGKIVNVASLAGLVHPAGMASYNAVKAGVVALTETLGHELAGYGVTAHVVCPSYFRSDLLSSRRGADRAIEAVVTHLVETSPFTAEQIAAAVLAGIDAGDELILPDPMARAAYDLKLHDRAAYDAQLRRQAARLEERGTQPSG
jgi:NAD(P)-dependent dehydrogenase (short-subunit alcohol dehydrogenase family)